MSRLIKDPKMAAYFTALGTLAALFITAFFSMNPTWRLRFRTAWLRASLHFVGHRCAACSHLLEPVQDRPKIRVHCMNYFALMKLYSIFLLIDVGLSALRKMVCFCFHIWGPAPLTSRSIPAESSCQSESSHEYHDSITCWYAVPKIKRVDFSKKRELC